MESLPTTVGLANAANARDLGGLITADGRTVRRGVLYRANALNRLSEEDVAVLAGLGLACLVDFRHGSEIDLTGADRLPATPPRQLVALPVFDPEYDVFTRVSAVLSGQAGSGATVRLTHDEGDAVMRRLYRWFVSSTMGREQFGAALRLIAAADALPLMFHCTAGKDRTGWLSALVLSALGVDHDQILADYLRTNDLNETAVAHLVAAVADRVPDPTVLKPLLEARAEYLLAAFDEVDRAHGGVDRYLRTGLGVDEDMLAALRTNLLD
jgi:protein-tyrosine phosphatase